MASRAHVKKLRHGAVAWNAWRAKVPGERPDLRDWDFERTFPRADPLRFPVEFRGYDFTGADLHGISARNSIFSDCNFDDCAIDYSDLCFSCFHGCSFAGSSMRVAKIGSAEFLRCKFTRTDLAYASAEETRFQNCEIRNSSLEHVTLVKADFSGSVLRGVKAYGISTWDLVLAGTTQRDISIGDGRRTRLTIDRIELAQFINLLIKNAGIRDVIDTMTSKVVLLLGRFTPARKAVLDRLRQILRSKNYVPMLFDFAGPTSRDLTETVRTLAHLARFVIVDLTEPKSVPHELAQIVPFLPSVPVHPLIAVGERPYAMFEHQTRYPWVLPTRKYDHRNVDIVAAAAIAACERRLRRRHGR